MKKIFLFLSLFLFYSCEIHDHKKESKKERITYHVTDWTNDVELVVIDSCEYLFGAWGNATTLTHKGNCKNCKKERGICN